MNALEIVQQAAITLGYEPVTSIENPQNPNAQRLVGALNRATEEVLKCYDWQALICQTTFLTDDSSIYNSSLKGYDLSRIAPNFDTFITSYLYDYTSKCIIASITYDAYQFGLSRQLSGSARRSFILKDNHICFMPDFAGSRAEIGFVYKTAKPIVNSSTGTRIYKEFFNRNDDESILDSKLLLRGLLWKFKAEMGYDYAESYRDFQSFLGKLKDQDSNRRNITPFAAGMAGLGEII
ncbi:MAG: hypothetical protein FWC85_02820 [Elusimicrobia bacterium]|nr:hypothetical protein [Elusimicrobiota bacterium]